MPTPPRRRGDLQIKLVIGLLFISLVPLLASAFLIEPITEAAQNFVANHAAKLRPHLKNSHRAHLDLIRAKKELFRQIARRFAENPQLRSALDSGEPRRIEAALGGLLSGEELVFKVAVLDPKGAVVASAARAQPVDPPSDWREKSVSAALPENRTLRLTFAASKTLLENVKELGAVIADERAVVTVRKELESSFRTSFLLLFGGVVVLVTLIGIFLARQLTRRIDRIVTGTREVAAGDLDARVPVTGRDELTELASAFNRMVRDLKHDREQIAYLQRVGAWQDVARKLAHEIKNPLTPIQLAMQQCVSSYQGDDERFRKLLADADEIVAEEIANLRRLVDAFRVLGQLPRVEPAPLDLGDVVRDLKKDPQWIDELEVVAPEHGVEIRGDRLMLRRVLANLVENGVHAGRGAGKAGRVRISWRSDGEVAELFVDDEGPGVPADKRETIFEPYITSKAEGTGLGLTISKKIAIEHRGSLSLAREPSPLGGARFVLEIPVASASGAAH